MGKKLLLAIRISRYNEQNPGSSLNVNAFTLCEDLLEQFNAATSEVIPFGLLLLSPFILPQLIDYIVYRPEYL